ncbi:hypothetical protein OE88DRAFT_139246 [Heliocybe sulcata]|uniref:Uncharacterized protein n=1 Tax=Heliocybe sulcata TaxID=5364 RepID=A0A5C3NJT4_9AGAM|nr:hypothetical protein OE88DRAFT_139246 [Heliocybe sulcata]
MEKTPRSVTVQYSSGCGFRIPIHLGGVDRLLLGRPSSSRSVHRRSLDRWSTCKVIYALQKGFVSQLFALRQELREAPFICATRPSLPPLGATKPAQTLLSLAQVAPLLLPHRKLKLYQKIEPRSPRIAGSQRFSCGSVDGTLPPDDIFRSLQRFCSFVFLLDDTSKRLLYRTKSLDALRAPLHSASTGHRCLGGRRQSHLPSFDPAVHGAAVVWAKRSTRPLMEHSLLMAK